MACAASGRMPLTPTQIGSRQAAALRPGAGAETDSTKARLVRCNGVAATVTSSSCVGSCA